MFYVTVYRDSCDRGRCVGETVEAETLEELAKKLQAVAPGGERWTMTGLVEGNAVALSELLNHFREERKT